LTDLFTQKVTIYNDIPADMVNPRLFNRFVIEKCLIRRKPVEEADGTIGKVVNSLSVTTKDVERYKPFHEYVELPKDIKKQYYTANVDDFIVMAEVDDVVTTSREFQDLQDKYKDIGFSVTAYSDSIHGMSVDNVKFVHA
jgi:hypothetical protein